MISKGSLEFEVPAVKRDLSFIVGVIDSHGSAWATIKALEEEHSRIISSGFSDCCRAYQAEFLQC